MVNIVFSIAILVVSYLYYGFAWMTIAKKLGYSKPWIAWIPLVNLILLPILGGEKDWKWVFVLIIPALNLFWGIMWLWDIFKKRNYSGWLSLVILLGIIPIGRTIVSIVVAVIFGMVAFVDR